MRTTTRPPSLRRTALAVLVLFTGSLQSPVVSAQGKPPAPIPPARPKGNIPAADQARSIDRAPAGTRFKLNYDKADIVEVVKFMADVTGRNFILPESVRGKITVYGPVGVSPEEAYQLFLAALDANNLSVTPTGRYYKILPKKDTIRTDIPTFLDDKGIVPFNEGMATQLFRVKNTDLEPVKTVLQQFVTRDGEITTFPPNVLIISDMALNLHRVARILEQLDQPGSVDEIHVLQVENAPVTDLVNVLNQVFTQQGGGGQPGRKNAPAPIVARDGKVPPPNGEVASGDGGGSVNKIIADERTNKLIVIAPALLFERVKELVRRMDVPTDTNQVHVYYLENADAEELAQTLQALSQGQSSSGGGRRRGNAPTPAAPPAGAPAGANGTAALFSGEVKVTADKANNALMIIASPGDYRNLVRVIQQLDVRRRQVFIEAVIMEVKLNNDQKMGVDLHTGYAFQDVEVPGVSGKNTIPLVVGSEVSSAGASLNVARLASLSGFIAGLQGPSIKIDGLPISLPSFGVILSALQKNSDVNVISTPHLMTSDNEEAEIKVGSNVPFQAAFSPGLSSLGGLAGSTGTTTSALGGLGTLGLGGLGSMFAPIQRQPVELALKIKPQVNESDFVKLEIDEQIEEISSVDPQLGPTTAKRSVKTTVVAKDQSTIVVGGLIQERVTNSESKIPILGSLPILGNLFRQQSQLREKTNLLLFLTPYVIRDQADFRRIFERKMKERQEFVARFFGNDEQYAAYVDYARKRGPLALLRKGVMESMAGVENGGTGKEGELVITPSATVVTPAGSVGPEGEVKVDGPPIGAAPRDPAGGDAGGGLPDTPQPLEPPPESAPGE